MLIAIEAAHANKTPRTGVEWYCYRVIQELKHIIPSDVRVVLYSGSVLNGDLGELPANWSAKVLKWPLKKGWSQFRLSWELFRHPPDVFFAPGQLVPWYCPQNTIVTIHDSAFMADKKSYWWGSRWYLKFMNLQILKKAKTILVTAKFNADEINKYYGDEFVKKIRIVPLAYDSVQYNILKVKSEVGSSKLITKPYLISIGRLEEKKNTKRIIEAFNLIKEKNIFVSLKLLLVGNPGVGYNEVESAIESSPYHDDIVCPGYVNSVDLVNLLANAEAFVFPSLYEGFGMPVLEAMAVGCPVVAANNTALPEVGGNSALYTDPKNVADIAGKTLILLQDKDLRQRKIVAGLEHVKGYSWAKTAKETWGVINSCQKQQNLLE